jgi:hypothetical protein
VIALLICLLAALVVFAPRLRRRTEMSPCGACGIAQAGAARATVDRCATCQQREQLGERACQAVRAVRAEADAAAWR